MQSTHDEIQEFLKKHVGRCDNCGHALRQIATMHRKNSDGRIIYDSGLSLMPTHWTISEVDEGESTGTGCTQCERGWMSAIRRDRVKASVARQNTDLEWEDVYCVKDEGRKFIKKISEVKS